MTAYAKLVTTKSRKLSLADGSKVEVNLYRHMGKPTRWGPVPAWEQALLARMDNLFRERGLPKYVMADDADEGYPVYEAAPYYFLDDTVTDKIFAGYVRGHGRNLRFEKWERFMVKVPFRGGAFNPSTFSAEISETVRGLGCHVQEYIDHTKAHESGYGHVWFVVVSHSDPKVLTEAKALLEIKTVEAN